MKAISGLLLLGLTVICARSALLQLPEPPQQNRAWHSDADIPTNILSAAEKLYEQGFPDPRGCEYREIEVTVSGVWDAKATLVKTHGWVLPKKTGTNQFAICWNGLIYPVGTISAPVDLHAEVTNLFRQITVTNKVNGTNLVIQRVVVPGFGWRNNSAAGEGFTVFITNALSTRVLLLLRCGEIGVALTNWTPNPQMMFGGFDSGPKTVRTKDPYLEFAGDWAWAMFDRMISAHQRGDEVLALVTARQIAEVQPTIEAECAKRGFKRQPYYDYGRQGQEQPYLTFLGQLPQILADLERRAKEPAKSNIIESGITNYPDQTKRIAALIDDLDLVGARQWSQPGGVNPAEDPIVAALINEGDAAVEPLLNCLETDKRLTRSVGFGRDFFRGRTVIPVHDAAKVALLTILRAGFADDAAEMRAYWDKYKNFKLEDRWYAILNDDSASARWSEAAANMVQPENVRHFPGGFSVSTPVPTNAPVRMGGVILRAKSNPSVSELMARRALEVPTNDINAYNLSASCQMALCLAAWDPPAGVPVAKTLSRRACTVMTYSGQQLGPVVAKLAAARMKAGDSQAFDDYVAWLKTTTPEQMRDSIPECFKPLQENPTNTLLQSVAMELFANTNSAWGRLPWNGIRSINPFESDFTPLPAFRVLLLRELDKTDICGSIIWRSSRWVEFEITNYPGYIRPVEPDPNGRGRSRSGPTYPLDVRGSRTIEFPESNQPTNGTISELRWCDWIALSLASGKHISPFNPFAPIAERDEAIDRAKTRLEQP